MHEGHRQRLYKKLRNGVDLEEHELLEAFLFIILPRVNTNPIAHDLLNAFGSTRAVFDAEIEQLTTIKGIGINTATSIKCIGLILKKAYAFDDEFYLQNYGDFKAFVANRFRNKSTEMLEIYCLERDGKVKYIYTKSDYSRSRINVDRDEIARMLSAVKPFGILVAHNHFEGHRPSEYDNEFTKTLLMMCALTGITLYDHCIYLSDNEFFSYFEAGMMDKYRQDYSIKALYEQILKKDNPIGPAKR